MKPILILILSLSFTLNAIGQSDSGFTNKAEAKNLTANGVKEGKWIEYLYFDTEYIKNSNESYYRLLIYKNGKRNGIARDYTKDGILKIENPFINDTLNGVVKQYYENGKIEAESSYKNGLINGVRKFYNQSGILLHETHYVDDKENGIEKEYYDSGKIKNETQYTNGLKVSTAYYDERGDSINTYYTDNPLIDSTRSAIDNPKNINYKELYGKWKVTNYRNIGIRGLSQNDMDTEMAVMDRCFKEGMIIIDSNGFREIGDFCGVVKCDRFNFEKECAYHVRTILADKEGLDYLNEEEFDWENEGATVVSKKFMDIIDENYNKDKITVIDTKCGCDWGGFTYKIFIINQNKFALYSSADIQILERIK